MLGERPGVVLAANSLLDRYPADLQTIPWHLLVADEALRYVNPATDAHRALAEVRAARVPSTSTCSSAWRSAIRR